MKHCPHCGAELQESARFCPHCMTTLNEKRVIPTPKYLPIRWLSATVAVLVLALAVGSVWTLYGEDAPVTLPADTPVSTTAASATVTDTTAADSTTSTERETTTAASATQPVTSLTTLAESFAENPTGSTTVPRIPTTTTTTTGTTGRVPPFLTTTATTMAPTTTKASTTTTTTKKTTTTTTTAAPTYPAAWDTVYCSTTDDGLPIEEVTWTYKVVGEKLSLYRFVVGGNPPGTISCTFSKTLRYNIPMSQCIILTGFDAPTKNGIYRIPAAIDGKVVVGVDMGGNTAGACHFNDQDIAPTVKRIYLPPELLMIDRDTINQCTALEDIYLSSHSIWIEPEALPATDLNIYGPTMCYALCSGMLSDLPVVKQYCSTIDEGSGINSGFYSYYRRATWRSSIFALIELYD